MAKAPKTTSQPSFSVTSGRLDKDNWTSREVALRIAPDPADRTIRITVWNPYYNRAYLNNQIEVALDGRNVLSDKLNPARSVSIDYALMGGEPLDVEVKTEACMDADPLDPRERGVILRLAQEPLK